MPGISAYKHSSNTLVCQQLQKQRVLLATVNDVGCAHTLRQAPHAALHPAWPILL